MRMSSKSGRMGKTTGFLSILALCLSLQAQAAASADKKSSGKHHVLKATKETVQPFYDNIPGARWDVFEQSSHMPHVEETERFNEVVGAFLATLDE